MTHLHSSADLLVGPLQSAIASILKERRAADYESIRSLWRIGDAVLALRSATPSGELRRVLQDCAANVCLHPASLDDAARAALAFPPPERDRLLERFAAASTPLTRSHVIALARATRPQRARSIEALLSGECSVRELRAIIRPSSLASRPAHNVAK